METLARLGILLLLVILNGVFAMSEISLVSSRKVRLERLAKKGSRGAKIALKLSNDPQKFLPTVQIGMTAVSIVAGLYGGESFSGDVSAFFARYDFLKEYSGILGVIVIVIFTTFLTMVVGELVPKTIGLSRPEPIALILGPVMNVVYYVAAPFIWLLNISTKFILRLLRFREQSEPPVTEEELEHLIQQSSEHGVLEKQESDMMRSIFRTADRNVNTLMTHRQEIIWIDVDATTSEVQHLIEQSIHTNFPVCDNSMDKILGIVSIKDILVQLSKKKFLDIRTIMKQPVYVPESMPALEVLENFRNSGVHVTLVVNEYGSVEGIVTLHDVVESIFGNIPLAKHHIRDEAVQRKDGSWLIDGVMQTYEWSELLGLPDISEEDTGNYNTLGGFIMHQLGRIPKPADHFFFRNHQFEVMDMDGKRVDKVLARKMENA
ncbi:MAG: HlyC/CorC family transporter [Chitinophagales bacterium]|nr:HlyC/CorC family transporter [Chitinophagales bacterium]